MITIESVDPTEITKYSSSSIMLSPSSVLPALSHKSESDSPFAPLKEINMNRSNLNSFVDSLFVDFGSKVSQLISGPIFVKLDPRLSFSKPGLIRQGTNLVLLFEKKNINRDRLVVSLPATWEGIQAAKALQQSNIKCNLAHVFSLAQASAAAKINAHSISVDVGDILNWHNKATANKYKAENDPGVAKVKELSCYLKERHNAKTEVIPTGFCNLNQVADLSTSNRIIIRPDYLEELSKSETQISEKTEVKVPKLMRNISQKKFRWALNQDFMLNENLAGNINDSVKDLAGLHKFIRKEVNKIKRSLSIN